MGQPWISGPSVTVLGVTFVGNAAVGACAVAVENTADDEGNAVVGTLAGVAHPASKNTASSQDLTLNLTSMFRFFTVPLLTHKLGQCR